MEIKDSKYEQLFRDQSVWRSIFAMAVPSLLTIIIMIFYNLADMIAALIATIIFVYQYRRMEDEKL